MTRSSTMPAESSSSCHPLIDLLFGRTSVRGCGPRLGFLEQPPGLVVVALVRDLSMFAQQPDLVVRDRDEPAVDRRHPVAVVDRADVDLALVEDRHDRRVV